jgi:hypothetical protein
LARSLCDSGSIMNIVRLLSARVEQKLGCARYRRMVALISLFLNLVASLFRRCRAERAAASANVRDDAAGRDHLGMMGGIIPEWRAACSRNQQGPSLQHCLTQLLDDLLLFLRDRRRRNIIRAESGRSGPVNGWSPPASSAGRNVDNTALAARL